MILTTDLEVQGQILCFVIKYMDAYDVNNNAGSRGQIKNPKL